MTSKLYIEISRDGWTNGLQLSINERDENGSGFGYRIAGPKFNGSGKTELKREISARDAEEIRKFLDAHFPDPKVEKLRAENAAYEKALGLNEDAA